MVCDRIQAVTNTFVLLSSDDRSREYNTHVRIDVLTEMYRVVVERSSIYRFRSQFCPSPVRPSYNLLRVSMLKGGAQADCAFDTPFLLVALAEDLNPTQRPMILVSETDILLTKASPPPSDGQTVILTILHV